MPPGGVPPPNQSLVTGKGTASTGSVAVHPYGFTHNSQTYNSSTGVYDYNHAAGSEHYGQVSHIVSSDLSIIFIICYEIDGKSKINVCICKMYLLQLCQLLEVVLYIYLHRK